MGLTPALLIQYFEWKKISEEEIDMTRRRNYWVKKNSFRSYVPNVSITGHQECFLTASATKIARTHGMILLNIFIYMYLVLHFIIFLYFKATLLLNKVQKILFNKI